VRGLYARVIAQLGAGAEAAAPALWAFATLVICTVLLSEASTAQRPGFLAIAALCAAGSISTRWRASALGMAAALQAVRVVQAFPATANHAFLQLVLLVLAALLAGGSAAERTQLLRSCRAITAAVFLHAGLQKVLYGAYFDGRMLALLISKHERYQWAFQPIVGASEVARLASLNAHVPEQGPFLADSALLTVIANATWLLELALAALLLTPLSVGAWLGAALIVLIEAGARETVFGAVMLGLLALFLQPAAAHKAQRILIGLTLVAAAIAFGILPGREQLFLEALP
jgi:hypothetical protein